MIELESTQSMRVSLAAIRNGNGGLDARRSSILERVSEPGKWASFPLNYLEMKDLAYLTAKTGHEFAILRGKNEDILFHGENIRCHFGNELVEMLLAKKVVIYGHSHPGEELPVPSPQDRVALERVGQYSSKLISGRTGTEITFTKDLFDDFI